MSLLLEISGPAHPEPGADIQRRLVNALERSGLTHELRQAQDGRLILELMDASPSEQRYIKGLLESWNQVVGVIMSYPRPFQ